MKKYLALVALLAVAACGKKEGGMPAADTMTTAPAPMDSAAAKTDSAGAMTDTTMARDSAHAM